MLRRWNALAHSRSQHNVIPVTPLLHPFPDDHLRLLILVVVCAVDEVASGFAMMMKSISESPAQDEQ
jgi:hypothetical protein